MLKYKIEIFLVFIISIFLIWSCNKPFEKNIPIPNTSNQTVAVVNPPISNPATSETKPETNCDLIVYSDTLVFLKNQKDDYKIRPLKSYKGEYGSIPYGLEIDHNTGEINITKSETGLKYKVYFVPDKTTDTCYTYLSLSGIDYRSKIYILDQKDTLAIPIYNSNTNLLIPGVDNSGSGNSGSGKGTEFDDGEDDDNGDGTTDEPLPGQEVIPQGVAVSKKDGKIGLERSKKNGLFGLDPKSGSNKKVKMYYRLDDNSNKALNFIEIQFHYYETLNEVPVTLKDKIEANQLFYSKNILNTRNSRLLQIVRKPRPPDIVIVGRIR